MMLLTKTFILQTIKLSKFLVFIAFNIFTLQGHAMNPSELFFEPHLELLKLIQKGQKEKAERMINNGLILNTYGAEGITPLFWLILQNDLPAIKLALELGADPNLADKKYGDTPIAAITGVKSDAFLKLLLEHGGNPNIRDRNGEPALFAAIGHEKKSQIDLLLAYGADINLKDNSNINAALHATYLQNYELAHYLVENGANYTDYSNGGADIAWRVHESISEDLIDRKTPNYKWALKLKMFLESKGIKFPPPSPAEIRAQWEQEKNQNE